MNGANFTAELSAQKLRHPARFIGGENPGGLETYNNVLIAINDIHFISLA